jgi:membrane-associated phospholipid phosphatase
MYLKSLFLTILVFVFGICDAQNFDIDLLRSINNNESHFKNDFTKASSASVPVVYIGAPVALLTVGLARHDKKLLLDAAYMAGGFALSTIITQGLKVSVQRQRPFAKYPFIVQREEADGYSFPSGHTSSAFYSATSISLLYPKWYVIAPSFLWASCVGYARMYEGVHYPTDVLVGALVGAGSALITYKYRKCMDKKHPGKKSPAL